MSLRSTLFVMLLLLLGAWSTVVVVEQTMTLVMDQD
uniref:Fgs1 n=1 Tax=Arundo donax TaxID=35708 RepID=A0A0A9F6Q8_ARUDO